MAASTAFDRLASTYDRDWTDAPAGRLQRDAVWRNLSGLFRPGDRVLDLGCGTGEDAAWLMSAGVRVTAIDSSPRMIAIARNRGIDAHCLSIERAAELEGIYDGAISNFGPLNCADSMDSVRRALVSRIRRGGVLAICVMGRFCLWETVAYLLTGCISKAIRRWSGSAQAESLAIRVCYPTVRQIRRALEPDFALVSVVGIGIAVPPSFVARLPAFALKLAAAIDRRAECVPLIRGLSDHRLLIFIRQ